MRALLQMTMETEDTTERLSAPTVPNWNFSPATPISTPPQQQHKHSGRTQKLAAPKAPNNAANQHLQRSHFDQATAARTPGSSPEPAFSAKTTSLLPKNRIQPNGARSRRRARESELLAGLAVARRPERRAGAGRQGLDRVGLASRLRPWPPPSPFSCSPETETGVLYKRKEKILLRVYGYLSRVGGGC